MKISNRALSFMIRALDSKKEEIAKKAIIKSILIGFLLKYYNFDDQVVAAGYLSQITKYTDYTLDNLSRLFGGTIHSLLLTNLDTDKSIPWKDQIKQKFKQLVDLPDRNKAIIAAENIIDLEYCKLENEDIISINENFENLDFEEIRTYYDNLFDYLDNHFDSKIQDRFLDTILSAFYNKTPKIDNQDNYQASDFYTDSSIEKQELTNLKNTLENPKPAIFEFGKNSASENFAAQNIILDYLINDGYKMKVNTEKIIKGKFQEEHLPDNKSLSLVERNFLITAEIELNLLSNISNDAPIFLVDRTLFDVLTWLQLKVNNQEMSKEKIKLYLEFYEKEIEFLLNTVRISYDENKLQNGTYYQNPEEALQNCYRLLSGKSIDNFEQVADGNVVSKILPIMNYRRMKELQMHYKNQKTA